MYTQKSQIYYVKNQNDIYRRYMALHITYPPPKNVKDYQITQLDSLHIRTMTSPSKINKRPKKEL